MKHRRLDLVQQSRREALGVMIGGALVTACSSTSAEHSPSSADDAGSPDTGSSDTGTCAPPGDDVGAAEKFSVGSWSTAGVNNPYIVGQDANGFFAYSTSCTHAGCNIGKPNPSSGKTVCPCHGSQFDGNGAVLVGPAQSPLPHFAVAVCDGEIYVDPNTTVDPSTRTPAS